MGGALSVEGGRYGWLVVDRVEGDVERANDADIGANDRNNGRCDQQEIHSRYGLRRLTRSTQALAVHRLILRDVAFPT